MTQIVFVSWCYDQNEPIYDDNIIEMCAPDNNKWLITWYAMMIKILGWILNGILIDYYDHWYVWIQKLARNNSNYDVNRTVLINEQIIR